MCSMLYERQVSILGSCLHMHRLAIAILNIVESQPMQSIYPERVAGNVRRIKITVG